MYFLYFLTLSQLRRCCFFFLTSSSSFILLLASYLSIILESLLFYSQKGHATPVEAHWTQQAVCRLCVWFLSLWIFHFFFFKCKIGAALQLISIVLLYATRPLAFCLACLTVLHLCLWRVFLQPAASSSFSAATHEGSRLYYFITYTGQERYLWFAPLPQLPREFAHYWQGCVLSPEELLWQSYV